MLNQRLHVHIRDMSVVEKSWEKWWCMHTQNTHGPSMSRLEYKHYVAWEETSLNQP